MADPHAQPCVAQHYEVPAGPFLLLAQVPLHSSSAFQIPFPCIWWGSNTATPSAASLLGLAKMSLFQHSWLPQHRVLKEVASTFCPHHLSGEPETSDRQQQPDIHPRTGSICGKERSRKGLHNIRLKNREIIAYEQSTKCLWSSDATFIISSTDFAQYLKKLTLSIKMTSSSWIHLHTVHASTQATQEI